MMPVDTITDCVRPSSSAASADKTAMGEPGTDILFPIFSKLLPQSSANPEMNKNN